MDIEIRPADPEDRFPWLKLLGDYHDELDHSITSDIAFDTWDRVMDRTNPVRSRVAVLPSGEIIGFGNYVLHASTWSENDVCYVEDVFVDEGYRRQGVGTAIVRDIVRIGHMKRLHWVYTMANIENDLARAFSESVAKPTSLVRYEFKV